MHHLASHRVAFANENREQIAWTGKICAIILHYKWTGAVEMLFSESSGTHGQKREEGWQSRSWYFVMTKNYLRSQQATVNSKENVGFVACNWPILSCKANCQLKISGSFVPFNVALLRFVQQSNTFILNLSKVRAQKTFDQVCSNHIHLESFAWNPISWLLKLILLFP